MNEFTEAFNKGYEAGYNGTASDETMIVGIIAIVLIALLIKGIVRTFQRNWIAALLLMIFLPPFYLIWAFVEIFRGKPQPKVHYVQVQNVEKV